MKKLTLKTHFKALCLIIMLFLMINLIGISLVSAASFDNTESFDKDVGDYGKYEIKDWFGLLKLQDVELKTNTEICSSNNCKAVKEIIMYQDGVLIDDVRYTNLKNGKRTLILSSEFYILKDGKKILYELGTEVQAGTYQVLHEGKLYGFQSVDWQVKIGGKYWTEEWAVWTSNLNEDIIAYYDFNEASGDLLNIFNSSVSNGTLINTPTQGIVSSLLPKAYEFDSSSTEWINITDIAFPSVNGSIMIWAQPSFDGGKSGGNQHAFWGSNSSTNGYLLFQGSDTLLYLRIDSIDLTLNSSGNWSAGDWVMFTATWNTVSDDYFVYINDKEFFHKTNLLDSNVITSLGIGARGDGVLPFDGNISEMGVWNRTLNSSEIVDLYNSGDGIEFGGAVQITLNQPEDNLNTINSSIIFNCSSASVATGLVNLTLINDGVDNLTVFNTTATQLSLTLQSLRTGFSIGKHNWTCKSSNINNIIQTESERFFNISVLTVNNETFNVTTFETASETYIVNVNSNSSLTAANLIWDGTSFVGTQSGNIWSRTIDIPEGDSTKQFFWNFIFAGDSINSTANNVVISATNFSLCGGEGGSDTFLNFTFKNETLSLEPTNATISSEFTYWLGSNTENKTFTFLNASENPVYSFCAIPSNRSLNINYLVNYNNLESQQRTFSEARTLTNTTFERILYLLPTSLGIFTTFRTEDTLSNTLSLVNGIITRTISGSLITAASGLTDSSGIVVFFLNPDATYSASFSKSGFITNIFTFVPITDIRTVVMGITGEAVNGTQISLGLKYEITPTNASLINNTNVLFSFNVTGGEDITLISMNITNSSGTQLTFQSNAGQGFISDTINTGNNTKILGRFVLQTSNETLIFTRIWIVGNEFIGDYSLFRQLDLFLDYEFKDFTRLLIVILVVFGLMIFLSAGKITDTSESQIGILVILIWIFSVVGWLENPLIVSQTGIAQFSKQYGIAILTTAGASFFILRRLLIRRI